MPICLCIFVLLCIHYLLLDGYDRHEPSEESKNDLLHTGAHGNNSNGKRGMAC
jgi:hypothetical protein